jgi:hypothetical protein
MYDLSDEEIEEAQEMRENLNYKEYAFKHNLMSFEDREKIRKSETFKEFLYQWNHGYYNSQKLVGPLMGAVKDYLVKERVHTRAGWYEYYANNVRNYHEIYELIDQFARDNKLKWHTAVNYWAIHILDGAWQGTQNELSAKAFIERYIKAKGLPYKVLFATQNEDSNYGFDLAIIDKDKRKTVLLVQVKTTGYFLGKKASTVEAREQYNPAKYRKAEAKYEAPVWYLDITQTEKENTLKWWKAQY